jgi:hypothetical protein
MTRQSMHCISTATCGTCYVRRGSFKESASEIHEFGLPFFWIEVNFPFHVSNTEEELFQTGL